MLRPSQHLAAILAVAFAAPVAARGPTACEPGRFLVVSGGDGTLARAAGGIDDLTLATGGAITLGSCGTTHGTVQAGKRFTTLTARWSRCGDLAKLRLAARIAAPSCDDLTGTLRAKRAPATAIHARRSLCGDGIVDVDGGETCEPGDASACGGACLPAGSAGACTCAPTTTTTSTSSSTTTSSTSTSSTTTTSTSSTTSTSLCDATDHDGDGWSHCDGDCCDTMLDCAQPALVNPGAFDVVGNGVDDDCDGTADNALPTCDGSLTTNSSAALDYAAAMDLCQTTVDSPPTLAERHWGVIDGLLVLANGSGTPATSSYAIRSHFGTNALPQAGASLAILSTGHAAGAADPGFTQFQTGQDNGTSSAPPADWVTANSGTFPNAPGCPPASNVATVYDPVMLVLRVRVPTNARSFAVRASFYSSEFPEWVCSPFNDFFLVLLDSSFVPGMGETANPTDGNIAVYSNGGGTYPVGVNLASGNTGLFRQCVNGPTGCQSGNAGTINTCVSSSELVGTGFDQAASGGGCSGSDLVGGGTGWLTASGNVTPGETITVRFVVWDTGDHIYDSLVLLDDWTWSETTTTPGTQ